MSVYQQYKVAEKAKLPQINDISQDRWSDDLRSVPNIQWADIRIYLQLNCHWSNENFTARRQDKGYQLYKKGNLHGIQCHPLTDDEHIYIRASCDREISHTEKPYQVWCLLDSEGVINAVGCQCTNDLGDCKHVIALLYYLLERGGQSAEVDDKSKIPQQWMTDLKYFKEESKTLRSEVKAMKQDLDSTKAAFQLKLDTKDQELIEMKKAFDELNGELKSLKLELKATTKKLNESILDMGANVNNSVDALLAQEIGNFNRKLDAKDQEYDKVKGEFQQHMSAIESDLKSKIGKLDEIISDIEANMNNALQAMKTEYTVVINEQDTKISKFKGEIDHVTASTQKMESNTPTEVSFSAYKVNTMHDSRIGLPVIFEGVRDNYGNAYNTSTGIFTAPVNGTYFFYVSILSLNTPAEYCLYKGTGTFLFILADSRSGYDEACGSVVVHLDKGDEVCVKPSFRRGHGKFYAHHYWSHFCGFLVHMR